jgi:hypothetical protein
MNALEAKQVLQLYRPGLDETDPQVNEALQLARTDETLNSWVEEQAAFHDAVRKKFKEIPIPITLQDRILANRKIIRPDHWWQEPYLLATAAVILLLLGLGITFVSFTTHPRARDRFADYETRMVSAALREYRMEIMTKDLKEVRSLVAKRGAPSDFTIPEKLSHLKLTGGGALRWRNTPVAMVCYNRGDDQMLFLFVMNRSAVQDPPPTSPALAKVNRLLAASWTEGNKSYILAGPEEADFLKKYF